MNFEPIERFIDKEVKVTKLESKRSNFVVGVGHVQKGELRLHEYPATDDLPEGTGIWVQGSGFNYLRTSPVVKIIDQSESTVTFETEGGVYLLEKI